MSINAVAPLAGAWIEIAINVSRRFTSFVAPLAGAWIEIEPADLEVITPESLHSRERGLKYIACLYNLHRLRSLHSRERGLKCHDLQARAARRGRSTRGSVD